MPRPIRHRKISNPPIITGFKPYGDNLNSKTKNVVFLKIEEYEALRLCDFEMLNHYQAAQMMEVSRPTLTRIYTRTRMKIAEAFVLGKQIIIEGGKIYFDSEWFNCNKCGCYFNNPNRQLEIKTCPLCGNSKFLKYQQNSQLANEERDGWNDSCICTECGYEAAHKFGYPCKDEICPECGNNLSRKGIHIETI